MKQAPEKSYISKKAIIITLALGLVFNTALLAGCGNKADEAKSLKKDAVAVQVATITQEDIKTSTRVSGKITPSQEVNVSVKGVGGRVAKIPVDIGDQVKQGDLIASLDSSEIAEQVKQAEAALAMAKANGAKGLNGQDAQVDLLASQAKQAEIRYNDAKTNLDRMEQLFNEGAVSVQQLEQARTNYEAALSANQAAQSQFALTQAGDNPSREAVKAQIRQAEAGLALSRISLNNATVIAPTSGTIGGRNIDPGEIAVPGVPLVTIVNLDKVFVEANISESTITKVKKGDTIEVLIPSASEKPFEGVLTSITPNADSRTKAYPVKIEIDNTDGQLKAGMYAEIILHTEIREKAVVVPKEAVVNKNGRNVAYVIKENKAQEVPVEIGINSGNEVEIVRGLHKGEKLVVVGQQSLYNQAPVKIAGGK